MALAPSQELNADAVVPEGFPEWTDTMDGWGHKMLSAVEVCFTPHALFVFFCLWKVYVSENLIPGEEEPPNLS